MFWYLTLGLVASCWYLLEKYVKVPYEKSEPPLIPSSFPYVGHLIGILRHGSKYYSEISAKYSLPIYTLCVPRSKIYVVNTPHLVAVIDRQPKAFSFAPYVVEFAKRILVPTEKGVEALRENINEEKGEWGVRSETLKVMHTALVPGTDLDRMTQVFVSSVSQRLNELEGEVNLFESVRRLVTIASTDAVYGAEANPFKDPDIEQAFWRVDKNFALLGLNVYPKISTPKGSRSREKIFQAFKRYYAASGHEYSSRVIQARFEVHRKYGMSREDIEHFDLSVCYGLLVNTVPAVSWALLAIYSNPTLLSQVRETLSPCLQAQSSSSGIDMETILKECPLLSSLVQEILRLRSTNASGRVVMADTVLDNKYLLKKDSMLLIPSAELHNNDSVFASPQTLSPERFMQKKPSASAYRAFGGGASYCPGRFLAMNEICSILIMMLMKYDIKPVKGGEWALPKGKPHITTSILTPEKDVRVSIEERKEVEGTGVLFK